MLTASIYDQELEDFHISLKALLEVFQAWHLKTDQELILLGQIPNTTFYRWKKDPSKANFSVDLMDRISMLLNIYAALQQIFTNPENADTWLTRPNQHFLFGGKPPLDRMLRGSLGDIQVVMRHLDRERGGM